jgi:hypothetical protein
MLAHDSFWQRLDADGASGTLSDGSSIGQSSHNAVWSAGDKKGGPWAPQAERARCARR